MFGTDLYTDLYSVTAGRSCNIYVKLNYMGHYNRVHVLQDNYIHSSGSDRAGFESRL
jgi:extradiol dioxygenase family protein